jgi:Fic family protein
LLTTPILGDRETEVIALIDETREQLRFLLREAPRWHGFLLRTAFARNVQASTAIEGHNVSLDDVVAAVDGSGALEASDVDWKAVSNYRDATTFIIQLKDDPHFEHSAALLRSLHFMMMRHDLSAMPGLFRPGGDVVRTRGGRGILSHGLNYQKVPNLVEELVRELGENTGDSPTMVQAAMAHLNMMMIHPFKDGNGRMARALQTLVLARERILDPEFSSIEEYLGSNTRAYYEALAEGFSGRSNQDGDARPWVRFVLVAHFRQAMTLGRRIRESERLWEAIEGQREHGGLDKRAMGSLYDAAMGIRVRRPDHIRYADVSERVATSDLKKMVDDGLMKAVGERRGRHYVAGNRLRRIRLRIQEERSPIPDPFELTT